jgi:L-malate glycosyltransferase
MEPRSAPLRILHVTTFLQGGAGKAIVSLATAQRDAGHDVVVVADAGGAPGYGTYPEYEAALRDAGVPYWTVSSTFTRDLALSLTAARQVWDRLKGRTIDLVHAHSAIPGLVGRMVVPDAPLVHTMHGWGIAKTEAQADTDLRLLARADVVVTPSEAARVLLRRMGLRGVDVEVIPYGLDLSPPATPIDEADAILLNRLRTEGRPVALCIGTIGTRKQQSLLVEAIRKPGLQGAHAVFLGDGDGPGLVAHAESLGVGGRVHVLGARPDAARYLPRADALVLPSRNEGLPLAVLEALRAGVPVVASDIPGMDEAVEDGRTGWLFAPGDAAALAAALARAFDTRDDVWRRTTRQAVFAERYTRGRMVDAYAARYAAIVTGRVAAGGADRNA